MTTPIERETTYNGGASVARSRTSKRQILESGFAERSDLDALDGEVREIVEAAGASATEAPWPDAETATTHVFSDAVDSAPPSETLREPPAGHRDVSYVAATLEALSDAMEDDPSVFVLGEGIGVRGGNFWNDGWPLRETRRRTTPRHPDLRTGLRRPRVRCGDGGISPGRRLHVHRLRQRRVRGDHQPDRQDAVHVEWATRHADRAARMHRRRPLRGDTPLGQLPLDLRALSRPARVRSVDALRRQGPLLPRAPWARPRAVSRAPRAPRDEGTRTGGIVRDRIRTGPASPAREPISPSSPSRSWCESR